MKRIAISVVVIILLLVGGAYLYLNQPQYRVVVPEYLESAGTIHTRRTRMDGRSTAALPSHSAGNSACTLRLVHGARTALPVAIWM